MKIRLLNGSSAWFAACAGAALYLGTLPADATTLDWNQVDWTAGSLSQSFELDAENPGDDLTITITGNGTSDFNPNSPDDTTTLTGGLAPTQESLDLYLNQFKNDNKFVTVTLTFNYTSGVRFVDFQLFDVDAGGGWTDQIRNIKGSFGATNYAAVISGSANNVVTGTGLNQRITGTASSSGSSGNANATLNFGSSLVTKVSFDYGNEPGTTVNSPQRIGVSEIHFTPRVPELHPAFGALTVCALALAFRAWRRAPSTP